MNQQLKHSLVQRILLHKPYSYIFGAFLTCLLLLTFGSGSADLINSYAAFASPVSTERVESHQGNLPKIRSDAQPESVIYYQHIPLTGQGDSPPRKLKGREVHDYPIAFTTKQYIRVAIMPKGIDAILTLYGPDGKKLQEVDTPKSAEAIKSVMWTSETVGTYHLQVHSSDPGASAGEYEIVIRRLLPATVKNKNYILADRLTAEGWRLHEIGTEEALCKAAELFTQAIPQWHTASNWYEEATTLMYLGEIYHHLCEYQKALDTYNRARKVWRITRAPTQDEGLGWANNNIGSVYKALGEYQKALDSYFYSLQAYTHWKGDDGSNNTRGIGIALTAIGSVYISLGEPQKALTYLTQAIPNWQATKDTNGEARALHRMGEAYTLLSNSQKALNRYSQALQFWRNAADLAGQTSVLLSIGKVYLLLGTYSNALDSFSEALHLARLTGDRRSQAATMTSIGKGYHLLDQKQKALEYYTQALPLHKAVGDREGEADTLYNMALLERDQGRFEHAQDLINKALALVESVRTSVASKQLRATYLATVRTYYDFSIDLFMQMDSLNPAAGYAAAALQVSEQSRARSLLELLAEPNADIRHNANPQLLAHERSLQRSLQSKAAYQMQLLSSPHSQEQANAVENKIEMLTAQYQEVEAQIRASSPRLADLTQPTPLELAQIQQQVLDKDTVLLEYALGEEYSYLWVVSSTSLQSFRLPKRTEIEAAARQVYKSLASYKQRTNIQSADETITRLLRDDTKYMQAAAALSEMLLRPVADQLARKRLLLVTDGALQYVPFAALPTPHLESTSPTPSVPLIVEHEIVSVPSASTLAIIRREKHPQVDTAKTVAVLADPVFDAQDERIKSNHLKNAITSEALHASRAPEQEATEVDRSARDVGLMQNGHIPRLPSTREEAKAIVSLIPKNERLLALDFAASHATATTQLGQYRIIHFATHSILNNEHPELSGIVLSLVNKRRQTQDGFLRVHEVGKLKLSAQLVVLSACQTALGKEIKGEGLVGLTRAFMNAGVPRVLSSLWDVDSKATAELMTRFYKKMIKNKLPPAAALREAQVSMLKETEWKSPYYWAAFALQGDWR